MSFNRNVSTIRTVRIGQIEYLWPDPRVDPIVRAEAEGMAFGVGVSMPASLIPACPRCFRAMALSYYRADEEPYPFKGRLWECSGDPSHMREELEGRMQEPSPCEGRKSILAEKPSGPAISLPGGVSQKILKK